MGRGSGCGVQGMYKRHLLPNYCCARGQQRPHPKVLLPIVTAAAASDCAPTGSCCCSYCCCSFLLFLLLLLPAPPTLLPQNVTPQLALACCCAGCCCCSCCCLASAFFGVAFAPLVVVALHLKLHYMSVAPATPPPSPPPAPAMACVALPTVQKCSWNPLSLSQRAAIIEKLFLWKFAQTRRTHTQTFAHTHIHRYSLAARTTNT